MVTNNKVAVLMGGFSNERDISLRSGEAIFKALQRNNVNVISFDPKFRRLSELIDEKISKAFIALHGPFGEDGHVQGILEYFGIPFTGSGLVSSALAMDKIQAKRIFQSVGLKTPRLSIFEDGEGSELDMNLDIFPAILKPNSEGSSLGVEKVEKLADLPIVRRKVAKFGEKMLLEKFIGGRELTCGVLHLSSAGTPHPLPIVEVIAPGGSYNFHNKYESKKTKYICPPKLPREIIKNIEESSIKAFETLGCRHWARVDFIWDSRNEPEILELNTVPGMTEKSLVPMAAEKSGLTFDDLVLKILNNASLVNGFDHEY